MLAMTNRIRIARLVAGPILGALIAVSGLATDKVPPTVAQSPAACSTLATPAASPSPVASPADQATPAASLPDTDLAWLTVQDVLLRSNIDLTTVALPRLTHEELRAFAEDQVTQAREDLDELAGWRATWYPDSEVSLAAALTTIGNGKMELDLPAGSAALEAPGARGGIERMCASEGPTDEIYVQSRIDLAQQYIDLAQVAVVFAHQPDLVAAAEDVIMRERAVIGQLVTWQGEWFGPATPVALNRI